MSLAVAAGEIVGLIGENGRRQVDADEGARRRHRASAGVIRIDGRDRTSLDVGDAIAAGIAFVHQELNLFDNLDVAANVFIGREPLTGGPLQLIDRKRLRAAVQPLLDRLGCDFGPDTSVADLSIAQRQLLEIAKALSLEARVVIMDEPTSSLTIAETNRLLGVVRDLKASGVAVIFISHRLHEVEQCTDRVVVLRDGRVAGYLDRASTTHDAMIRLMIGRDLKALYTPPAEPPGPVVLDLVDVRTTTYPKRPVSLSVHAGEILGLAGLVGAGRTELARTLFGIDPLVGGTLRLNGKPLVVTEAARRDRARHLSHPRGPQAHRAAPRRFGRREYFARRYGRLRQGWTRQQGA